MAVRIVAIRKANGNHYSPYEAVSHYSWLDESDGKTGINDRPSMVDWVQNKGGVAYVRSNEGRADCFVNQSASGTRFLKTNADSRSSNNLLNLPEC